MRRLLHIVVLLILPCFACAQINIGGGITISGGVKITSGGICTITTTSLPSGTVGTPYSATIQTTNCQAPLVFTVVTGALPSWASLNSSTGAITGTPDASGPSSFTIQVVDNLGHPSFFNAGLSIASLPVGNAPALPDTALMTWCTTIACTPSPNTIITVGDGTAGLCAPSGCSFTTGQLSTAVTSLSCGQTLEIQNTVYLVSGTLLFNKVCDQAHWITITRDPTDATFPAEGVRVSPCYSGMSSVTGMPSYTCSSPARHMPFIQKTSSGAVISIIGSYYRFVGIEWGRTNGYDLDFGILNLTNAPTSGSGANLVHLAPCTAPDLTCMNGQPTNNIFDRNIVHGDAQRQTTKAFALGGTRWIAVLDSYIYDISLTYAGGAGDAVPLAWGNGTNITNEGYGKFHNNLISASTMGNLFCGSFSEPVSPATGKDGIPYNVWFNQDWFYKNWLWDTQRFQTQGVAGTIEGVTVPPAGDQEFILYPDTMQLKVNQVITMQSLTANDSTSGINRSPAGTSTLNGVTTTCASGITANGGICTTFINVGSGNYISNNQFNTVYTAPASVPAGDTVTVVRSFATGDSRSATLANSRTLSSQTVFTIVSGTPVPKIFLTPKIGDLQIQPSYIDAAVCTPTSPIACGNNRQFELLFAAISNTTTASTTWSVDGITNGDTTRGRMCSITSTTSCLPPSTNDLSAVYWSGTAVGSHRISVISDTGVTDFSDITVSATAPIVGWDYRSETSKNGFELKCGRQILLENFLIENDWGSNGNGNGQGGQFMLIHPFNQNGCSTAGECKSSVLSGAVSLGYGAYECADITIRNGKGIRQGAGMTIGGSSETLGIHRVSVSNVLCVDCSFQHWSHGFNLNSYFAITFNGGPAPAGVNVTSVATAGSTVTVNTATPHGLIAGTHFCLSVGNVCGIVDSAPNGNSFIFTQAAVTPCSSSCGIVASIYSWQSNANPMASDISYKHVTEVGDVPVTAPRGGTMGINQGITQPKTLNFTLQDSILPSNNSATFLNPNGGNTNCDIASGTGSNNTEARALVPCMAIYTFNHLALLDSTAAPSVFISSPIWQPASSDVTLFRNYNGGLDGGDFRVVAGGPYDAGGLRQASDGLALGANVDTINTVESTVRAGVRTP